MALSYFPSFNIQFVDPSTGLPLSLGKVYAYYPDGVTAAPTYNQAGNPNSFPITLDAAGCCQLKGDDSISYTIIAKSSTNAAAGSWVGVTLPSGGGGASVTMDTISQGTLYKKITASQYTSLTSGSNSTLHYHSADRAWATLTGKPSTFTPATHASTHNSGGSDALAHDNLNPSLAGTGITYGHINTGTQTILGQKTFDSATTTFQNSSSETGMTRVVGNGGSVDTQGGAYSTHRVESTLIGSSNITSEASQYQASTGAYYTIDGGNGQNTATLLSTDGEARLNLSINGNTQTFQIFCNNDGTTISTSDAIYVFPEAGGSYNLATREWVTSTFGVQSYNFTQSYPANVWTITHNLGYKPVVQSWNSSDDVIIGTIHHVSNNQCTILFSSGQSGGARCV